MALTVDTIESVLKANVGKYITDMKKAEDAYTSWRNKVSGGDGSEAKEQQTTTRRTRAKKKATDDSVKEDEKSTRSAKKAADAESAAADKKAEAEHRAGVRLRAVVAQSIAARNEEASQAESASRRITEAGSKRLTAAQTRLMSTTSLGAVPGQGPVDTVNYALRDQIDLRNKLRIATIAGDQAAVDGIQDQLLYLSNLRTFKQAGLDDTQAAIRAEQALSDVVQARAAQEARIASQGIAASGRQANATRNLGRQFQDIGVGLVGGQGLFLVLAQQIPQVADAVTDLGKKTGIAGVAIRALTFFATPVGAILLAAASAAAIFGSRLLESDDASKKSKNSTLELSDALTKSKFSTDAARKALDDYNDAQRRTDKQTLLSKAVALESAQARLKDAEAANAQTRALIEQQRQRVAQNPNDPDYEGFSTLADQAEARLRESESRVKALRETIGNLSAEVGGDIAKRASDAETEITRRYEDQRQVLALQLKERQAGTKEIARQNLLLNNREKAEQEALRKRREAERDAASAGTRAPSVTAGQVGGILQGAFGGSFSGTRTAARNRAVGGAANSYHVRGQAVDFVPSGGVGSISKQQIRDALAEAGVSIKELLGPGDKGHSDHYHIAFGKTQGGTDGYARSKEKELERKQEEREREAERRKDAEERYNSDLNNINSAILSAKGRELFGIEEIANNAIDKADADEADRRADFEKRERESGLDYSLLKLKSQQLRDAEVRSIVSQRTIDIAKQDFDIASANRDRALELQTAELSLVTNRQERLRIQEEILEAEYESRRLILEANLAEAKRTKNKVAQAEAEGALANLPRQRDIQREGLRRDSESPLERYRREVGDVGNNINDSLEQIEVRGLESLNDKLTDTISNVFKLGGAFGEIANQIISDLIRIAVQQAIIKPLAGGGDGGGILGFLGGIIGGGGNPVGAAASTFSSIFKGVSGRAVGGPVNAGTFYKTSEYGTEGYASFSQPGRVIPLGEMNTRPQGGTTIVQQSFTLDARGGITTPELLKYVNQTARTAAAQAGTAAYSSAVRAAPGAVAKAQRFGSNG